MKTTTNKTAQARAIVDRLATSARTCHAIPLLLLFMVLATTGFSQIDGPYSGYVNSYSNYSYDDYSTVNGSWTINYGTIINQYHIGTTQYCVVQWPSSTGSARLYF